MPQKVKVSYVDPRSPLDVTTPVGDFIDIGPECFAAADRSVIYWRGENYVPQAETSDVDTMLGFDVNDFESRTYYAIFNDPDGVDMLGLPEPLKPQLLDVPLYEDESLARVLQHAKLMNDDRSKMRPHRSPVIVRSQTVLKSPYRTIPLEDEK